MYNPREDDPIQCIGYKKTKQSCVLPLTGCLLLPYYRARRTTPQHPGGTTPNIMCKHTDTQRHTGMYVEYDWTFNVYKFRIGNRFDDFRGTRSLESIAAWRALLAPWGLKLGRKTDSRVWPVVEAS